MVVFVVHSRSNLETYLIAFSLLVHYGMCMRRLKVVVVESQENGWMDARNHDLKPWCGTGTVSDIHINHVKTIYGRVLDSMKNGAEYRMILLGSIRLVQRRVSVWNMEKPFHGQQQIIQVSRSEGSGVFGLLYHPILLTNQLRRLLLRTNQVIFMSLSKYHGMESLLRELARSEREQQVVLLNHACYTHNISAKDYDYIVGDNMIGVEHMDVNERYKLPSTVFWIPSFKARINVVSDNDVDYRFSNPTGNIISIDFKPRMEGGPGEAIISRLDLLRGLKHADISLDAVNYLISVGQIPVHYGKL